MVKFIRKTVPPVGAQWTNIGRKTVYINEYKLNFLDTIVVLKWFHFVKEGRKTKFAGCRTIEWDSSICNLYSLLTNSNNIETHKGYTHISFYREKKIAYPHNHTHFIMFYVSIQKHLNFFSHFKSIQIEIQKLFIQIQFDTENFHHA